MSSSQFNGLKTPMNKSTHRSLLDDPDPVAASSNRAMQSYVDAATPVRTSSSPAKKELSKLQGELRKEVFIFVNVRIK